MRGVEGGLGREHGGHEVDGQMLLARFQLFTHSQGFENNSSNGSQNVRIQSLMTSLVWSEHKHCPKYKGP